MQRTKWIERQFTFDFPIGILPNILERLSGTAARMADMTNSLADEIIIFKPDNKWSIKEHIGHLVDLEDLHEGRIDDFLERKKILQAADMSNAATHRANHNEADLKQLINDFKGKRTRFVARLRQLDDDTLNFQSLHPRLKIMMRPIDMAYFTAEHDDHHLSGIREILQA